MTTGRKLALAAAAVAALVALFLAVRPGDDEDDAASPPPPPAATTPTTRSRTPPPVRPAGPGTLIVRITVRGGTVVGGLSRPSVERGRRVELVVRSDVTDEVHLHGYDVARDVAPDRPARLRFRATIPGRFEVELEERGLRIAELEVRP